MGRNSESCLITVSQGLLCPLELAQLGKVRVGTAEASWSRGHRWTSEGWKDHFWGWKAPSSSSPGAGGPSPPHHPRSFLCTVLLPLSADLSLYLWLFCSPKTCPGFGHGCGPTPASGSLAFHHLSAHRFHSTSPRESAWFISGHISILVQSAVVRGGLWNHLGWELGSVCLLLPPASLCSGAGAGDAWRTGRGCWAGEKLRKVQLC